MAYAVGLIATDGCLTERGRAISFVSQDVQLVETLMQCLGREPKYRTQPTSLGRKVYRVQFKDAVLYRWLEHVGVTPRKSLTLGTLHVPESLFPHLVRGLLDGDGSIIDKVWRADTSRRDDYSYEWLRAQFVSASREHVAWLHAKLQSTLDLRGWISTHTTAGHRAVHHLVFGKHDSIALLTWIYADPSWPCLERKRDIWNDYLRRHPEFRTRR